ncbi:MAG: pyridoxine 5'-phosphate synthase [Candidatus Latescibacterota bacterium]
MIRLSANVDKVATLRQSRGDPEPDPVVAAVLCEQAGAEGITFHLRGDRRHIQDRDVDLLAQMVKTEMNFEMAATEEMIARALVVRPAQCTLVPERDGEVTTEDGVDVLANQDALSEVIPRLKEAGMRVSIFSRLDADQIRAAKEVGADRVELFTGPYAKARLGSQQDEEFSRLSRAAQWAERWDLGLNAGHGLDVRNLGRVATIPNLLEVSIGQSLWARAVFVGLERAVGELLAVLKDR